MQSLYSQFYAWVKYLKEGFMSLILHSSVDHSIPRRSKF